MTIPFGEAAVLGVVQGITEFLPISSDGHLALAQMLFGTEPDLATEVVLHAGTLAATFLVLREKVLRAIVEGLRLLVPRSGAAATAGGQDALATIVATIPTGIVGLLLKERVERWSSSPTIVGLCLLLSAAAVASTRWAPRGERDVPTLLGAVIVGIAQGTAVLPGLSRSATTIASLLWLGVRAPRAFELSFLMSLPAVAGAVLLEGRHGFHGGDPATTLLAGTAIAFVVGVGALHLLRRVLVHGKLALFAVYLVPLALATLAWGWARP